MTSICKWAVPVSVSVTFTFAGKTFTFSESGLPEFNPLQANCDKYRIKRIAELMNAQDPYASTPWALAQRGPNPLVIGYIPIPFDSPFSMLAQEGTSFTDYYEWTPRNPYCPSQAPGFNDPDGYPIYGLGAIPSTARFHQRCPDPDCDPSSPDPCPTYDTIGWMMTGVAAGYNPDPHKPWVCARGQRNISWGWTDLENPNNSLGGFLDLVSGATNYEYTPITTTIEVEWP